MTDDLKTYPMDEGATGFGYAAVGIPVTPWLKPYLRYDVYRSEASWNTMKAIYSLCPNIQLHKNLLLQIQYNLVDDHNRTDHQHYSELIAETYVRF